VRIRALFKELPGLVPDVVDTMQDRTRRQILRTTAVTVGAIGLAGCSSSSGGGGGGGGTPTATGSGGSTTSGGDGSSSGSEWAQTSTVEMTDGLKYEPKTVQVSSGTTVTWENVGSIGHTISSRGVRRR